MKRVLVVDDSPTIRKMLKYILNSSKIEAVEAEDGLDALEKLFTNEINLAIVDLNMPRMDGISLIKEIRKDSYYKFMPIIMLTTESGVEDEEKAHKAGANAYIVKPVKQEVLLEFVNKFIGA